MEDYVESGFVGQATLFGLRIKRTLRRQRKEWAHHLALIRIWMADGVVKNDTFRTLATDTQFKGKVKEDMLIRLLEAFVWRNSGKSTHKAELSIQATNTTDRPSLMSKVSWSPSSALSI